MARSRVRLFELIRRDRRLEDLSIRQLAERHGVHRRTVRQALAAAVPPPRKTYERAQPALGPWKTLIDGWLVGDKDVPRKQRHTARRVWQRLVSEHGASVSERTVDRYVRARRAELGLAEVEVTVPQEHPLGEEAECDFGEFTVDWGGQLTKMYLFCLRLSASGRAVHYAFPTQGQEAFLEGHVRAFDAFGGVPKRIRYDNLKPAVVKVLKGRDRQETERFIALRSHYGFDSFFCTPGKDGAHEKGGVEGDVGRFRRRHLVPLPRVTSLAQIEAVVAEGDRLDDGRFITGRGKTVGAHFAREQPTLQPLPAEVFDPARLLSVRVDGKARVCVRQNFYAVPARYATRRLPVRLTASAIEVLDGAKVVARHPRAVGKAAQVLELDHYLEVPNTKPGALPGATALAQARAAGVFTDTHQRFWDAARKTRGDAGGTRALIEVLLAHRSMPAEQLLAGVNAALRVGSTDPQVVLIEARRSTGDTNGTVVPIDAGLTRYDRPTPTLGGYDDLLKKRNTA